MKPKLEYTHTHTHKHTHTDEIVCAKTIHEFKTKLDERMYKDGTARA